MTDPFLGEIQLLAFPYAPAGWSFCNGALLPLQQAATLFSLLGTQYGGNGTTNFALPNLFEQAICNQGQGRGLSPRVVGEVFGAPSVGLLNDEMPRHAHSLNAFPARGTTGKTPGPVANAYLTTNTSKTFVSTQTASAVLTPNTIALTGGSVPHENRQPFLAMNYSIAMQGVYPAFS